MGSSLIVNPFFLYPFVFIMAEQASAKKRILMVFTNHTDLPQTEEEKKANKEPGKVGWYLPEAAHPYVVFKDKGYDLTFVSPKGGLADCDPESVSSYAKDPECIRFTKECLNEKNQVKTVQISEVKDAAKYDVIFYVGGTGVMWDFPDNDAQNKVAAALYENGGIVSAVCHGPAALVNVKLSDGKNLIDGKRVTGFTNDEEAAIGKTKVVPFLLETALRNKGAITSAVKNWGSNVEVDGRLVTGQNPGSASGAAKAIAELLEKK